MTYKMTMNDKYGDNSDHIVCEKCGMCITCGDCKCEDDTKLEEVCKIAEEIF
jgi:Fe2+ or Zn2+ uptake regulation protein